MRHIEETQADRFVRLLRKRHPQITSSPEKSRQFLIKIGLISSEMPLVDNTTTNKRKVLVKS
jgi:hypothetical protein